ncbi:hypothetical protein KJ652_01825 [Patescibacteria group bacterium]|nr:hypothetical protein [Patescibacteria group bacterium]
MKPPVLVAGVDGNSMYIDVVANAESTDTLNSEVGIDVSPVEMVAVEGTRDTVRNIAMAVLLAEAKRLSSIENDPYGRQPLCILASELCFADIDSLVRYFNSKVQVFVTYSVYGQQISYNPAEIQKYVRAECERLRKQKQRMAVQMA